MVVEVVKTFHVLAVVHVRGGGSVVVEGGRGLKTGMQVGGRQRMELASLQTVTDEAGRIESKLGGAENPGIVIWGEK